MNRCNIAIYHAFLGARFEGSLRKIARTTVLFFYGRKITSIDPIFGKTSFFSKMGKQICPV